MKTRYDWQPGKRWKLLAPEGSSSIQQTVVADARAFEVLYLEDRLIGEALADATAMYGAKPGSRE